jgi:hypothetical protein
MKLAFNGLTSGLGNNGGSRTVLKCAEVLNSLGHRCDVISSADNFTWFDHDPIIRYVPDDLDAIINVAAVDVVSTLNTGVPVKVWYIRAHELWSNPEHLLRDYYRNDSIINIVNSKGLQQQLATYGADSYVVYQGLDFDWWGDRKLRPKDKIRIGCLHTTQPRKRWEDFKKLSEILGHGHYEYVGMGSHNCKDGFLTEFIHNANVEQLNNLYSSCHIWFAPTDSEGLHNVPMEANLCGCLVVCSDHPLNGMVLDYAFEDTAMIYRFGDLNYASELIRNPDWSLIDNMRKFVIDKIGSRETNMMKLIDILEKKEL